MIQRATVIILSSFILISCKAVEQSTQNADFAGDWSGHGWMQLVSKNKTHDCPSVSYRIETINSHLTLRRRSIHCLGSRQFFPEVSFRVQSLSLYYRNVRVGDIRSDDKDHSVVVAYRADGIHQDYISLSLEDKHLFVTEEHWVAGEKIQVSFQLEPDEEELYLKQAVQ